jgi:hypothetical protein
MTKSTEHNPGTYDEICSYVRFETEAEGAIVIIFNGKDGFGFSVQGPKPMLAMIPATLERMAAEIRKDLSND